MEGKATEMFNWNLKYHYKSYKMISAADTVQLVIQNYFSHTLLAFPNKTNELLPPAGTF